jgi:hypothetical protein
MLPSWGVFCPPRLVLLHEARANLSGIHLENGGPCRAAT